MPVCETCGNDYDKAFEITMMGKTHTFDSFECAIHTLAPQCDHCGVKIAGHGMEKNGRMFAIAPDRRRPTREVGRWPDGLNRPAPPLVPRAPPANAKWRSRGRSPRSGRPLSILQRMLGKYR
jgi:hypothetical protein